MIKNIAYYRTIANRKIDKKAMSEAAISHRKIMIRKEGMVPDKNLTSSSLLSLPRDYLQ